MTTKPRFRSLGVIPPPAPTPLTFELWMPGSLLGPKGDAILAQLQELCGATSISTRGKSVNGALGTQYTVEVQPPFKANHETIRAQVVLLFSREYEK